MATPKTTDLSTADQLATLTTPKLEEALDHLYRVTPQLSIVQQIYLNSDLKMGDSDYSISLIDIFDKENLNDVIFQSLTSIESAISVLISLQDSLEIYERKIDK